MCSNFSHTATARAVLERAGLLHHFDAVVISEDVGLRKPRAEIFAAVADALALAPAEIVHVGDNLDADVAGAAAVGQRTVWLTRRVADPEAALPATTAREADHRIADLAELEALLLAAEQRFERVDLALPVVALGDEARAARARALRRSGSRSSSSTRARTRAGRARRARRPSSPRAPRPSKPSGLVTTGTPSASASRILFCTPPATRTGHRLDAPRARRTAARRRRRRSR